MTLSTEPVLLNRHDAALEPLAGSGDPETDGLAGWLLRAAPGASVPGPNPAGTGGQHYLVVNGALVLEGRHYPACSTVFLEEDEAPLRITAASVGVEVLILQFPREESRA